MKLKKLLPVFLLMIFSVYVKAAVTAPQITSSGFLTGGWTQSTAGSFSFSGSDSQGAVIASYRYAVDEDPHASPVILAPGADAVLSGIAEGSHTITAYAVDNTASDSPDASVFFGVDTTAPNVPAFLWSSHTENVKSTNNNFSILLDLTDSIANTTSVSGIAGILYVLSADQTALPDKLQFTASPAVTRVDINNVANGTFYFRARAVDAAGNSGPVYSFCVVVDYQASILEGSSVKVAPTVCRDVMRVMYKLTSPADSVKIEIKEMSGRTIKTADGSAVSGTNIVTIPLDKVSTQSVLVKVTANRPDGKFEEAYTKAIVKKQ